MRLQTAFLFLFAVLMCGSLYAQIDTTLVSDPATIVSLGNIEAITAAITLFLTFFSGLIPGLKNIKSGLIRAIAVGLVVVIAVVEFRLGWFSRDSFDAILKTLAPTFAYSGFAWEVIKTLLGFFKIDLKNMAPGVAPAKFPPNVSSTL